jgi:hypothetical protein
LSRVPRLPPASPAWPCRPRPTRRRSAIIEYVGYGALGQELRIADFGKSFVVLGAGWGAPGATEAAFMSDANGAAIPATAGSRAVGRLTFNELTNLAAGNRVECLVYPFELET